MDDGFKMYILFLLWIGVIAGIPFIVGLSNVVGMTALIAWSIALAATIFAQESKKDSFKKNMPGTYCHIWIFVSYCIIAMFRICFSDIEHNDIDDLGYGTIFYAAYVPIALIVETSYKKKHNERE